MGQAFEPGLLVRSNGDTLRGELENGFWQEPPTYIRFRHTATSPVELFKPRQLQAVSFTGGRYFRYEILPIDHAAKTKVSDLQEGNLTDIQVDSLLAEVLLDGPVPLLRVVGFGTVHYLFRRPNQPILDVCERKYLRRCPRGNLLLADGNNYRAQLGRYFGDCPAAGAAAETIPFTAASSRK